MKNAIVTGGSGFFGINLVEMLLNKGYKLTVTARPGSGHNERLYGLGKGLTVIENDISDIRSLPVILGEKFKGNIPEYDTFFHLAWHGDRNDMSVQSGNISDTMNALETAAALKCRRFICSGSQAEYGVADGIISENLPPDPFSAYGAAKAAACHLTKVRAQQLGIDWIWARIFSLIGKYEPKGRMLPDLIDKLKRGEKAGLSSCEQYWDYLDAEDAAHAFILLGEKGRAGEIYNIANGDYRRLKEYTEEARQYFSKDTEIEYGEPPSPFVSLKPSVEKLKMDTGWSPVIEFERSLKWYI